MVDLVIMSGKNYVRIWPVLVGLQAVEVGDDMNSSKFIVLRPLGQSCIRKKAVPLLRIQSAYWDRR